MRRRIIFRILFTSIFFAGITIMGRTDETKDGMPLDHKDYGKQPWVIDIEKLTVDNSNFRRAWWTGKHLQMTVMSIKPGDEIGLEVHPKNDQFIRVEEGQAKVVMGKTKDDLTYEKEVSDDWAVFIPAGYWHNIINTGTDEVKVYVIYSPPEHPRATIHKMPQDDPHHK
jgi:mannose-6-phosphate isomerase-like protein (cupin superfamily)